KARAQHRQSQNDGSLLDWKNDGCSRGRTLRTRLAYCCAGKAHRRGAHRRESNCIAGTYRELGEQGGREQRIRNAACRRSSARAAPLLWALRDARSEGGNGRIRRETATQIRKSMSI